MHKQIPAVFIIGNDCIRGVVDCNTDPQGPAFHLSIINPAVENKTEGFGLRTPDRGSPNEGISLTMGDAGNQHHPILTSCGWLKNTGFPAVFVQRASKQLRIQEYIYCPVPGAPYLVREIRLTNLTDEEKHVTMEIRFDESQLVRELHLRPGIEKLQYVYYHLRVNRNSVELRFENTVLPEKRLFDYWSKTSRISFPGHQIQQLADTVAYQLQAVVGKTGWVDNSIGRDGYSTLENSARVIFGLSVNGQFRLARKVIEHSLRHAENRSGESGISSPDRPGAAGLLLRAVEEWAHWSGSLDYIDQNWSRLLRIVNSSRENNEEKYNGLLYSRTGMWDQAKELESVPGFDIADQIYQILGERAAANLAGLVKHHGQAKRLYLDSQKHWRSVCHHPKFAFIRDGRFVSRIGLDGSPVVSRGSGPEPDINCILPLTWGLVKKSNPAVEKTFRDIESLERQGAGLPGFSNYIPADREQTNPFAAVILARAGCEYERFDIVQKSLNWFTDTDLNNSSSWFNEYTQSPDIRDLDSGISPGVWAELLILLNRNIGGFRPSSYGFMVQPRFLPGMEGLMGTVFIQNRRVTVSFDIDNRIQTPYFESNCPYFEINPGTILMTYPEKDVFIKAVYPEPDYTEKN